MLDVLDAILIHKEVNPSRIIDAAGLAGCNLRYFVGNEALKTFWVKAKGCGRLMMMH